MTTKKLILNDNISNVRSVAPLYAEKEEHGTATITRFKFEEKRYPLFNLRAIRDGGSMFQIYEGHYTRLHIDGKLMMSDTPMERYSNEDFVDRANGHVLIAGLGIGLIVQAILLKPEVKSVRIIESNRDVIRLVKPKFNDKRLAITHADIFDWKPIKGVKFDTIYFDIWPSINTENLEDIRKLHNRFKFHLNRDNPKRWMNSWMKEYLQSQRAADRRAGYL